MKYPVLSLFVKFIESKNHALCITAFVIVLQQGFLHILQKNWLARGVKGIEGLKKKEREEERKEGRNEGNRKGQTTKKNWREQKSDPSHAFKLGNIGHL